MPTMRAGLAARLRVGDVGSLPTRRISLGAEGDERERARRAVGRRAARRTRTRPSTPGRAVDRARSAARRSRSGLRRRRLIARARQLGDHVAVAAARDAAAADDAAGRHPSRSRRHLPATIERVVGGADRRSLAHMTAGSRCACRARVSRRSRPRRAAQIPSEEPLPSPSTSTGCAYMHGDRPASARRRLERGSLGLGSRAAELLEAAGSSPSAAEASATACAAARPRASRTPDADLDRAACASSSTTRVLIIGSSR